MGKIITVVMVVLVTVFAAVGVNQLYTQEINLERREIELQDVRLELNEVKLKKIDLNSRFEEAINADEVNSELIKKLEQEKIELEERNRQLEVDLQAKRAEERRLASLRASTVSASTPTTQRSNQDLMRAVGIPESQWWAVDEIISRESGWNHLIWNRGGSGAYGLCQSLPASKMSSAGSDYMTNPITQLKWCNEYAQGYGGWTKAVEFSRCVGTCWSNRTNSYVVKDHRWW